jgi:hypothetical protein
MTYAPNIGQKPVSQNGNPKRYSILSEKAENALPELKTASSQQGEDPPGV